MPTASKKKALRPRTIEDLYGAGESGNLLQGKYDTPRVREMLQRRHARGSARINTAGVYLSGRHRWQVPYGVREAQKASLTFAQIATRYPWFVVWRSPRSGKVLRKYFTSLIAAIDFVACKAQYVDPQASVVSRHGYYAPTKLLGKFPRRWGSPPRLCYWCPRCMQPRTFHRTGEQFYALRKVWDDERGRYVTKDRLLALLACRTCGVTNRDSKFRASNQPVTKVVIKQGRRRMRRRR